jgi:N-acyl-D-amino-acid deacylase
VKTRLNGRVVPGPAGWAGPAALAALGLLLLSACAPRYDLLIRHGEVLDGTGAAATRADVGVRGDRIAAVGDLSRARAPTTIDATGLLVAPGFIDSHSHAGEALAQPELSAARPLLAQGITTVVINPDGGGAVDLPAQRTRLLEHGLGVNVAQLVPQGSVRAAVVGNDDRPPTAAELARMEALVRAGMDAGAFGLSSGLFYTPGGYAGTDEVIALARVAGAHGGVYQSHVRDEGDYGAGVVVAVDEVIRIAREAALPGIVTHIKALGPGVWGASVPIVERIEAARAEGVSVWADQYPYEASASNLVAALVPAWARAGDAGYRARLDDPATADSLRAGIADNLRRRGGGERIMFRGGGPLAGRTLAAVAAERGIPELDLALELLRDDARPRGIISFNMAEDDLLRFMRQPWTMTASDGGLSAPDAGVPHPRDYGTFPRKLGRYARDAGVVDVPTAVHTMTGLPARVYSLAERGALRAGAVADIVVLDLARVHDPATYEDPRQLGVGMVHVLVNGVPVIVDGEFTGALPGRVLHRRGVAYETGAGGAPGTIQEGVSP